MEWTPGFHTLRADSGREGAEGRGLFALTWVGLKLLLEGGQATGKTGLCSYVRHGLGMSALQIPMNGGRRMPCQRLNA